MTLWWFEVNAGRSTGASTFIHGRMVRTFHAKVAAVPAALS